MSAKYISLKWCLSVIFLVSLLLFGGCNDDTTTVNTFPDADHPRIINAISASNNTVIVTFSQPMLGGVSSTEDPRRYQIVQTNGGGAVILVQAAELDITSVTLTTSSQSDVEYMLTVSNVTDLQGRSIASGLEPDDPSTVTFVGTAPNGADIVDSDGDGLSDSAELRGWTVTVLLENAEGVSRHVTSDPYSADTDGDGVMDVTEKSFNTDPRSGDSDADELTDYQELNEIYSSPVRQDTDADGLPDGLEFNFFKTSASLADTDGDQLLDSDEILLGNRNPRLADLPLPGIEIGDMDLRLDVRFKAQSTTGTRELETQEVTSTLSQSDSSLYSNTDATTNEAFGKLGYEGNYGLSADAIGWSNKVTIEAGYTHGWSSSVSSESSEQTQEAYQDSLSTQTETTQEETVSREVLGASMSVTINIKSLGDIAFTISNLQISVLMQDPSNPSRLLPIATLVPDAGSSTPNSFNLGPLIAYRGPFIFSNDQIFPSLVEDLMRDPRGLMFKVANFDIIDEFGRNFAFTSQGINDRTGALVIDFGGADIDSNGEGETTERLRVSIAAGRAIEDTNGDDVINDQDQRVLFDLQGKQVGITVREALESILGLTPYDEDVTPSSTLSEQQQNNSYATRMVLMDTNSDGVAESEVETLWRVRQVSSGDNPLKKWEVLTSTGIDRSVNLGSRLITAGGGLIFAFVQDLDDDGIPARWEYIYGCSDTQADTDGDGLNDRLEVFEGWDVNVVGKGTVTSFSSCARVDSDGDGITDDAEANRIVDIDTNGDGIADELDVPAATDAKRSDTDQDKVSDYDEINGYTVELRFDFDPATSRCSVPDEVQPRLIFCSTDPLNLDSDGDTLSDGDEIALGTDPTADDGDKFFDNDEDGLVNFFEEQIGWQVTYYKKALSCAEHGDQENCNEPFSIEGELVSYAVTSNPYKSDADYDGLSDKQERDLGTDPNKADTDGDGLSDSDEIEITYLANSEIEYSFKTNPLDADSDNDLRSDGDEVSIPWLVYVAGVTPQQVYSDPKIADADFDGLFDYVEFQFGTHPELFDTDGDGYSDSSEVNPDRKTDPLTPDQLVEFKYTTINVESDCDGGSGEFYGKWIFEKNGIQDIIYDANADWNTGSTVDLNRAKNYVLNAGDTFYARIIDVYEDDGSSGDDVLDDEFVQLLPPYPITTGNQTITSEGSSNDAFVDDCKLITTLIYTEK
jgi:hypothetical protein